MTQPVREYYCKDCKKRIWYGFTLCPTCEDKREEIARDMSRFTYPKYGLKRLLQEKENNKKG